MKEKPDEAWDTFSFNRVKGFSGFYRSRRFRVVVAASPQKKKANPASLRSAAPSKGRGLHLSTKIGHETKKIRHKN